MRAGVDLNQPVLTIYDGTKTAQRALSVAASLARISGQLRVLIWADDGETAQQYKRDIVQQLHDVDIEVSYRRFHQTEFDDLIQLIRRSGAGLLVLGRGDSSLPVEKVRVLLENLDSPILVVRGTD